MISPSLRQMLDQLYMSIFTVFFLFPDWEYRVDGVQI